MSDMPFSWDGTTFGQLKDRGRRRRIVKWQKRTLRAFDFLMFLLLIKGYVNINDLICSFSVCTVSQ